ncbi:MAG: DMT family transporter [Anaerolineales bacterium]|nr:DMT family transporter [Anaerolineales bacterium]
MSAPEPPQTRALDWAGWALALGSVLAFSIVTPVSKTALGLGLVPATQNTIRFGLAAALLGATLAVTGREHFRLTGRALLVALTAGASIGLGSLIYLAGLTHVDSSVAAMIFALEPLFVLGLLALRGERFTYRQIVRLGLALGGVYLLIGPSGRVDLGGAGLIMIACLTFALPMALIQWFLSGIDSRAVTFYMVTGMLAVNLVWWLGTGREWHDPGPAGWLAILAIALVSTYAARLLMVAAIGRLGSGQVALLVPVEMMLTVLWSVLFLGDRLTLVQIIGGLLILLSASLSVVRLKRVPWRAPSELP